MLADAVLPIGKKFIAVYVPILITLIALISLYNRQKVHSSVYVPILIALIALISLDNRQKVHSSVPILITLIALISHNWVGNIRTKILR